MAGHAPSRFLPPLPPLVEDSSPRRESRRLRARPYPGVPRLSSQQLIKSRFCAGIPRLRLYVSVQ